MSVALIQSKLVAHAAGSSSATASGNGYVTNTTAGSLLVLVAWSIGASYTSVAPSINLPTTVGFTWVLAKSNLFSDGAGPNGGRCSIYYVANAGAMASSLSTSVTALKAGTTPSVTVEFACYEFSGVAVSPLDQTAGATTQTSSPVDAGSLVTTGTALIFAASISEDSISDGAGFTAGISAGTVGFGRSQYILNQAAGTIDTAFGANGSDFWGASAVDFLAQVAVPVVSSVAPSSGGSTSGGTACTVSGTHLTGTTQVQFGGSNATAIAISNDSTVFCTSPAHAQGLVDVILTTPGGSSTLVNGFSYNNAPSPSSVSPNKGPLSGGSPLLTITGTNFLA
jgi:hypothetical protein